MCANDDNDYASCVCLLTLKLPGCWKTETNFVLSCVCIRIRRQINTRFGLHFYTNNKKTATQTTCCLGLRTAIVITKTRTTQPHRYDNNHTHTQKTTSQHRINPQRTEIQQQQESSSRERAAFGSKCTCKCVFRAQYGNEMFVCARFYAIAVGEARFGLSVYTECIF